MPIHFRGTDAINHRIEQATQQAADVIIRRLLYIGEQCVNTARNLPTPPLSLFWDSAQGEPLDNIPPHQPNYIDWTANLRSSIGYIIVADGQIVTTSNFQPLRPEAGEGSDAGRSYAEKLAQQYPEGIALIFVAGMRYAAYVQQRGYDVTLSAQLLAEKLVKQALAA